MTLKISERELEKLLRGDGRGLSPPAGLLERLRADLPAELPALPEQEAPSPLEARPRRPAVWWRRPLVSLAATLALVAGASFVSWRGFREAASPASLLEVLPQEPPAAAAPEDKKIQEEEAAPLQDEAIGADRLAKSGPAASGAPQNEAARDQAPAREGLARSVAGAVERRDLATAPVATRRSPPPAPAAPAPAHRAGGLPGGIAGGLAAPPPPVEPAATLPTVASAKEEPMASPKDEPKVEQFAAAYDSLALQSSAVPERLESPSIEANLTESPHLVALRESEDRRKSGHLENPALQSDAGRGNRERAAALAAPPRPPAGAALQVASWDPVERALVAGRWPNADEIAAARPPKKKTPRVEGAKDSLTETKENDAESGRAKDSAAALREDLLDFFASQDKTPRDLLELRRRALHLAGGQPVDPELAELVRALNFAARIATPIN